MAATMIDVDQDALARAMVLMGARTKKDAVNTALREYVERGTRLVVAERLAAGHTDGTPSGVVTVPHYLLDTTGVHDLLTLEPVRRAWTGQIAAGTLRLCPPVRAEMMRDAAALPRRHERAADLDTLFGPPIPLPPDAWSWVDLAQDRLHAADVHDVAVLDLLVAATAAWNTMTVLHSNPAMTALATVMPHLRQRPIRPL